jgi:hypothetical protein
VIPDERTEGWAPEACTLPTPERHLRLAEFDELFATALRRQERPGPVRLRWELDPARESRARDLADRETECCSFLAFTFTSTTDSLLLDVQVPPTRVDVLDALAARAAAVGGTSA